MSDLPIFKPLSKYVLSMVIALSMSRACQPHGGALLLCMVVSDSIHRTCKSDVSVEHGDCSFHVSCMSAT
jgi:hypothetical protein